MDLIWVTQRVAYIPGRTNIGVIASASPGKCILIDTGLDDEAGRKVMTGLTAAGLLPVAIINTHAHADHYGANATIVTATGAQVYAPQGEAEIIQCPDLEPMYLFSGARPLADLQVKLLRGRSCQVDHRFSVEPAGLTIDHIEIGIVPLRGHTLWQSGVACERVLFCADALFSTPLLEKHRIPYFTDIKQSRETLTWLCQSRQTYDFFVPCHASPSHDVSDTAQANLAKITDIEQIVLEAITEDRKSQDILKGLCDSCGVRVQSAQEYYLMNTVVLSFLSDLRSRGLAMLEVSGNVLRWRRTRT